MSERRVLLDAAAFMDSPASLAIMGASTDQIREVVQRYLSSCYEDLGKAPRLLDGEELASVLQAWLPRRYGVKDPLAAATGEVLSAFLEHLNETEVVTAAFEQRQALAENLEAFESAVAAGAAHRDGVANVGRPETFVHRAEKTGRNDACPCGSGKKFKKCCGKQ